jgi:hypothetical protein
MCIEKTEEQLLDELEAKMIEEAEERDPLKRTMKKTKLLKERKDVLMKSAEENIAAATVEHQVPQPKSCGYYFKLLLSFSKNAKISDLSDSVLGPESKMDKLRREKAKKDIAALKSNENDARIVEALLKAREKLKAAGATWKAFRDWIRGYSIESKDDWYIIDLIQAAQAGNYNLMVDILEHPFCPIGPNEIDHNENITATFAAILSSFKLEQPVKKKIEIKVDVEDLLLSPWQRFMKRFRNKLRGGKLDICIKILMYKGGDIDFVKTAKDEDGKALLHIACGTQNTTTIFRKNTYNYNILFV